MSFDRAKVLRTAEKNLAQGKIAAAIKDYCQIVENDPRDMNSLNILGDLHVRQNSKEEAVTCFNQIAESYAVQGFTNKAIAMYKKIARLKPDTVEISAKLAPLYQTQGLTAEARHHYEVLAEHFQTTGQRVKALDVLKHIADLAPTNTDIRLKLADSFVHEKQYEKAIECFIEAGEKLLSKNEPENALSAFTQAFNLQEDNLTALRGIATAYEAIGLPEEAIALVERALSEQPDNTELLNLLVGIYTQAQNAPEAERVLTKLITREPTAYKKFIDIASIYLRSGALDDAARMMNFAVEQMLLHRQGAEFVAVVNEILARNPEHLQSLSLLVRAYSWDQNEAELKIALERLAEAGHNAGAEEEERTALAQLAAMMPNETQFAERLHEITGGSGYNTAHTHEYAAVSDEAVPAFETFQDTSAGAGGLPEYGEISAEDLDRTTDAMADFGAVSGEDVSAAADKHLHQELESIDFYISQGYTDLARESLMMLRVQYGEHAEVQKRLTQLSAPSAEMTAEAQPVDISADQAVSDFEFSTVSTTDNESLTVEDFSPTDTFSYSAADSEPVTYAADEIAVEDSAPSVEEFSAYEIAADETPATVVETAKKDPLADLFEEFRSDIEAEDEAANVGSDYETHYNLGLAYKEMGLFEEAVEEFQTAIKKIDKADGTPRYLQCCNLLGHCFMEQNMAKPAIMWFEKGLEVPNRSDDEEKALRYELATAYEIKGDLSKSHEIFSEIYAMDVSYRNTGDRMRDLQEKLNDSLVGA